MSIARQLHVIKTDGTIDVIVLEKGKKESLEMLQKLVGGLIQGVRVLYMGKIRDAWVNEEGLIYSLPINHKASCFFQAAYDSDEIGLVGDVVVVIPNSENLRVEV